MNGRAVLVTGCSSGIGRCAADTLRERGYRVFATARRAADVARLADEGHEALVLDLDDSGSVRAAASEVLERCEGRLYGLFNNGGYGQPGAVEDLSREVLRRQLETNLLGGHELTCHVLPAMRARREGRIVQNSSILGLVALRFRGAYVASKFALEGLSDALRLELSGSGVFLSLIEAGPISSRFRENAHAAYRRSIDPEQSAHRGTYPKVERRLAAPDDVGGFTLGPEAVVRKLLRALESRRPRARYYVTTPTYLLGNLKRVLSSAQLDRVLRAISRAEARPPD